MHKLFCATVLLFSALLVNTAHGYYGGTYDPNSRHGDVNFDTDMLWVGGEILPGNICSKLFTVVSMYKKRIYIYKSIDYHNII